jgi:hypothetical protein
MLAFLLSLAFLIAFGNFFPIVELLDTSASPVFSSSPGSA